MTRTLRSMLVVGVVLLLIPAEAVSQALTSLSSLRVSYNTRKVTVNPQGELKAQIEELDKQIAAAARVGQNAEIRRLLAKGMALLNGRAWTEVDDFTNSLVLRTDRVVADSTRPYTARLEQIYSPSIDLQRALSTHAVLRKRAIPAANGGPTTAGDLVKDFGTFDGVSRDLRESPFPFELDVHDVIDGTYQLHIEVLDEARSLGSTSLVIALRSGLDDVLSALESAAQRAPEAVRADILFPGDRIRNANRGRIELRTFDLAADLAAAQTAVAAVKAGRDPFAGRTGDIKRHYTLEGAGEVMPYRMYVPTTYDATRAFPLIVALHGLGATEDSFFDSYGKQFPQLAQQHGYIVAAPLGYRVDGFYGSSVMSGDAAARRRSELSEQDVMQVLQHVRQQYRIDESRIYLAGHSMGAIGTWAIAAKHPDIWAALAPISGLGSPATVEKMRHIPEIVVHGDADATVSVEGSRVMVAEMKKQNVDVKYIEVPGGSHVGVAEPNFPAIFEFFNAHRKNGDQRTGSRP